MVVVALLVLAAVGAVLAYALAQPAYAWAALGCCAVAVALLMPALLPDLRRRFLGDRNARGEESADEEAEDTEGDAVEGGATAADPQLTEDDEEDREASDAAEPVAPEASKPPGTPTSAPSVPSEPNLVFLVPGRKRFHAESCELLGDLEVEEITLEEARGEGFTPCTRCLGKST